MIFSNKKASAVERLDHYTEKDMLKIAALVPKSKTDLRNIATFIFLYISEMRITAFQTVPIKDVFIDIGFVVQDPSNRTYTKLNKSGETILLNNADLMKVIKNGTILSVRIALRIQHG